MTVRASADLVVLGGGPAGLAAAWWTARAGHRVVLLERGERPGGLAVSFTLDGVRVDLGSHRLHPSIDPAILRELEGILDGQLQRRPRNGRINLDGRLIRFPLRPADLFRKLPPSFALGVAADTLTGPLRRRRAGAAEPSFASVLRAGLGPTMCDRFYFPYARKLWGLEPDQIDAEQARRRVSASSPAKLLARVARGLRSEPAFFWYPRDGFGTISERLAGAAAAAGADVRLGSAATGVVFEPDGVTVTTAGGVITAPRVWSTIPLGALARIADPAPPPEVADAARSLQLRAMTLVYLVLDGRPYTTFDAHYLPDPGTPVSRVSEPANYRDGGDPPDRTVLCAEIPCARDDAIWSAADEELGRVVTEALDRAGLPAPRMRSVHVRRVPAVYPVYRTGYGTALAALDDWAGRQPGLLTLGRQGLFAHDNTHHTLSMALAAADALGADGSFDERAWASARARFETHVVED